LESGKFYSKKWYSVGFLTFGNIKDILLIALIIVITWKLIDSKISINIESFSFTDILSVMLAFFAIALSAAFYFKATDTSNLFYDNTYKFTKEMSEILGRIEAGFGERLKHIDEGYNGLKDKFDNIPFDVKAAKEEEKKEEEHIKKQESERQKIILDLMEKARVAGNEKEELLTQLQNYTSELDSSRIDLQKLQRKINNVEHDVTDVADGFIKQFSSVLEGNIPGKYARAPTRLLSKHFTRMCDEGRLNKTDISYMTRKALLDEDGVLTSKGAAVMREAIRRAI
jgi:glutathione peroxidase-family protein